MLITTVPLIAFWRSDKLLLMMAISKLNLYTSCILKISNELGSSIFLTIKRSGILVYIYLAILSPI